MNVFVKEILVFVCLACGKPNTADQTLSLCSLDQGVTYIGTWFLIVLVCLCCDVNNDQCVLQDYCASQWAAWQSVHEWRFPLQASSAVLHVTGSLSPALFLFPLVRSFAGHSGRL